MLGAAEALLQEIGARVYNYYIPDRSVYERITASVRSQLDAQTFDAAWAEGRAMTLEEVVTEALAEST